jgi:tetratricopeptide (TPR) repeat protein
MADAQILCTKCGNASMEARLECVKCKGRNARVCGKCGNQNSVAKNFCDKCGHSIADLGPVSPPPMAVLPGAPGGDIPATVIKHLAPPGSQPPRQAPPPVPGLDAPIPAARPGGALPLPGAPSPGYNAPLDDLWSAPSAQKAAEETIIVKPKSKTMHYVRLFFNTFAALAGASAAAFGVWTFHQNRKPEILVPKLAARYLEALRTHDYAQAYDMFSVAAKQNSTLEEFKASRDDTVWTWSNITIEYQEPGAILLQYDLKASTAPVRQDRVLFTLDGDRWARPYNWTLMRQVEDSFDKGEPDKGLILAQAAATVNPRDPMAWGYLCEAAYYRKSPADVELRCLRALELARTYPSNLSLKSLYHLHAILADTYHHSLNKLDLALGEYAEMLSFPGISPADQCQILLARAQAFVAMSRPGEALLDLDRGTQLCVMPQDQRFIQQMRFTLRAPDSQ